MLANLDGRNREVFRALVESYLKSGTPVGSRLLAREIEHGLSAATIRNVMQDLEFLGLLDSPHISAGRVPTELGLRLFVDELLEVKQLSSEDRESIEAVAPGHDGKVANSFDRIGSILSGLTRSASLVLTPKHESPIRHVDFVSISPDRALVVLVTIDGTVENRIFSPPAGQTPSALREAANFVNAIAKGRTVSELRGVFEQEVESRRAEIDDLATELAERGLAVWQKETGADERLIVRGRSNLLEGDEVHKDLDRIRELFDDLERKRDIVDFLELVDAGEGVKIFIGSENKLFSLSASTLVISPYMNSGGNIIGAVGVIGPTRINYGRIVPIVDYTAQFVGKLVADQG